MAFDYRIELKETKRVVCIICGETAEMRVSKRGAPYVYCGHCMTRTFLNSYTGVAGYFLTSELLLPVVGPHREILCKRVDEVVENLPGKKAKISKKK